MVWSNIKYLFVVNTAMYLRSLKSEDLLSACFVIIEGIVKASLNTLNLEILNINNIKLKEKWSCNYLIS